VALPVELAVIADSPDPVEPPLPITTCQLFAVATVSWIQRTSTCTEGSTRRDDGSANIGRARLVGAVADAVAESDVLAETADISGLATQGRSEREHVLNASLLEAEGQ
jgi:hypothetical protein